MAILDFDSFNAAEIEPMQEFAPIPDGRYLVVMDESEMRDTKAGDGQYLNCRFQVIEGDYKNRKLWCRLNLVNKSATAVEIAKRELSAICRAVGVLTPKDTAELHDIPLIVSVKTKPDYKGEMRNEIVGYYPEGNEAEEAKPKGSLQMEHEKELLKNAPKDMAFPDGRTRREMSPEVVVKAVKGHDLTIDGPKGEFVVTTEDGHALEIAAFAMDNTIGVRIMVHATPDGATVLDYIELPKF